MNNNEIFIELGSKEQRDNFMKWFEKEGFESFLMSDENITDPVSCLTDIDNETMDHGYIQIE